MSGAGSELHWDDFGMTACPLIRQGTSGAHRPAGRAARIVQILGASFSYSFCTAFGPSGASRSCGVNYAARMIATGLRLGPQAVGMLTHRSNWITRIASLGGSANTPGKAMRGRSSRNLGLSVFE